MNNMSPENIIKKHLKNHPEVPSHIEGGYSEVNDVPQDALTKALEKTEALGKKLNTTLDRAATKIETELGPLWERAQALHERFERLEYLRTEYNKADYFLKYEVFGEAEYKMAYQKLQVLEGRIKKMESHPDMHLLNDETINQLGKEIREIDNTLRVFAQTVDPTMN